MNNISLYIWSFIGKFGSQIIYLITTIILARQLSPEDFGTIGILSVIIALAQTIVDSGMGGALMLEKELNKENSGTMFVFNIVTCIFLYLIIFFLSPIIEIFFNVENLSLITRVLSLVIVINALGLVPKNVLIYNHQFKQYSFITLISVFASAILAIITANLGFGYYSLIIYQIINSIISGLLAFIISRWRINFCFKYKVFKRLFNFGFFTTITNFVDTFYENIITSIFGKIVGVALAGQFSQAKKLEEASTVSIINTICTTAFPIFAKLRNDLTLFKKEAFCLHKLFIMLVSPALILLGIFAEEIISILFGSKWLPASSFLPILLLAGFFMINESINRSFIKSLGKIQTLFKFTLFKRIIGIIIIIICGILSKEYILYGYVISTFFAFLVNSIVYSKLIDGVSSAPRL